MPLLFDYKRNLQVYGVPKKTGFWLPSVLWLAVCVVPRTPSDTCMPDFDSIAQEPRRKVCPPCEWSWWEARDLRARKQKARRPEGWRALKVLWLEDP